MSGEAGAAGAAGSTAGAAGAGAAAAGTAGAGAAGAGGPNAPNVNANGTPGASSTPPAASSAKWTDTFDADTKEWVTQRGFNDSKAVIDSYRNLEKLRGVPQERLLKLPEANAGADAPEWGEIYSKLGKPATPEGYDLKPKDPQNSGFTDWAKTTFHKLNLTTPQAHELIKGYGEYAENLAKQENEARLVKVNQQSDALKKEWGAAFDQNISRAQAAYRQFGIPDEAVDALQNAMGFDGVMKFFNRLGTQVGEHSFVGGDPNFSFGEGAILTPDQANAKIKALKSDKGWADKYLAGDVKARQEMERLHRMANPT